MSLTAARGSRDSGPAETGLAEQEQDPEVQRRCREQHPTEDAVSARSKPGEADPEQDELDDDPCRSGEVDACMRRG